MKFIIYAIFISILLNI